MMVLKEWIMTTRLVWAFIVITTIAIVGVDVYLYMDTVPRNSISQVIIDAAELSPMVPWFVGLVMGGLAVHWFDTYRQK